MSRTLSMVIWVSVANAVVLACYGYIWVRMVRDTELPAPWRALATGVVLTLALSIPAGMFLGRALHLASFQSVTWIAYVSLGVMFLWIVALGTVDLGRFFHTILHQWTGVGWDLSDPSRRQFLNRMLGGGSAALGATLGATSIWAALKDPQLKRVKVKLRKLPSSMSGLTLVQLSDIHIGPTVGQDFVQRLVNRINALKADLVVITGDLVDGSVEQLAHATAPLGQLQARYGTFFVTGNHEYYSGVDPWVRELRRLGIRVLRNECVTIGDPQGDCFDLAGIEDPTGRRFNPDAQGRGDVALALEGHKPERELVLLAHQPKSIHEAAEHGVGLQLSGHTHGGQIWPFTMIVSLVQPYVAGLAQHNEHTQIYVSRGTGYWGPPMRFLAPAEITHIELHAEA